MKKILILLVSFIFSVGLSAHNNSGPINRQETKNDTTVSDEFSNTSQMIKNRQFVLEADYLSNARGYRIIVPSTLNFIRVDSTRAVIQVGSNNGIGYNGVGGITAEGQISNWKVYKNDKKKNFTVSMTVMTPIGIYDIVMYVGADGNSSATISGMHPGKLIYDGQLVAPDETRVFKGMSV